jgi:hypothetical protein
MSWVRDAVSRGACLLAFVAAAGCVTTSGHSPEEDVELAVLMSRLQGHHMKLRLSARAQNWPLAAFYVHEMKETTESIRDAGIIEDGHPISDLVGKFIAGHLRVLGDAVGAKDPEAFEVGHANLLTACNGCHGATDHKFIVIQDFEGNPFPNQSFVAPAP